MRGLILVAAVVGIASVVHGGVAAGEKPVTVKVAPPLPLFSFGVLPKALSGTELRPAELWVSAKPGSSAALKELQLRLDRDIRLDASGIVPCTGNSQAIRRDIPEIEDLCPESIVGRGNTRMTITFPGQAPVQVASEMVILSGGGEAGVSTLYALAYITVPTPAVVAITLKARKNARGRYGTLVKMDVPVIAGGYAIVDELNLAFGRRAAGGERHGVVTATCTRGSLKAEAVAMFRDGSSSRGVSLRPCVSR